MRSSFFCAVVLCGGIILIACNDNKPWLRPLPTQPSVAAPLVPPSPPSPSRDPAVTEVRLGEAIEADIRDWDLLCTFSEESKRRIGFGGAPVPCRQFLVMAPSNGTLVTELEWNHELTGMTLLIKIETDAEEEVVVVPTPPGWSPLIGRFKVGAGQRYRVAVGAVGYDFYGGPFVLTTRMEK